MSDCISVLEQTQQGLEFLLSLMEKIAERVDERVARKIFIGVKIGGIAVDLLAITLVTLGGAYFAMGGLIFQFIAGRGLMLCVPGCYRSVPESVLLPGRLPSTPYEKETLFILSKFDFGSYIFLRLSNPDWHSSTSGCFFLWVIILAFVGIFIDVMGCFMAGMGLGQSPEDNGGLATAHDADILGFYWSAVHCATDVWLRTSALFFIICRKRASSEPGTERGTCYCCASLWAYFLLMWLLVGVFAVLVFLPIFVIGNHAMTPAHDASTFVAVLGGFVVAYIAISFVVVMLQCVYAACCKSGDDEPALPARSSTRQDPNLEPMLPMDNLNQIMDRSANTQQQNQQNSDPLTIP